MTQEEFRNLRPGDIVGGRFSGEKFMVMANYGNRVTAAMTVDMTNPDEWELRMKCQHHLHTTHEQAGQMGK